MRTTQRVGRAGVLLAGLALVATACLGEGGGGSGGGGAAGGEGGGGGEAASVLAAFEAGEAPNFQAVVDAFNEQSEAGEVEFVSATAFETEVNTRFSSGNPPDIAIFPQPGLLLDKVDQLKPLSAVEGLDVDALQENIVPGFLEATEQDGEFYGLPYRMAVKSIVWTPEPEFSEAGYTAPEDYQGFLDLVAQIQADGNQQPIALGAESGDATGWPFTDWIEEYMLRLHGPEVYDQWVAHELPFNAPEVREAYERFEADILPNVVGGPQGAVSTNFGDAFTPAFDDPPGAWLMRQGNFIASPGFFPDEVQASLDENVGTFYFPGGIEGGFDQNPVLLGGDLAARADTDSPAADAFMAYLATPEAAESWIAAGGFLSPLNNIDDSVFPDETTQQMYEIGINADVARYDGSDQMPGAVGAQFWQQTVAWVSGQQELDVTLDNIEAAWAGAE